VWDTKVERCLFRQMTGAAISLKNYPGRGFGMPNNAFRDIAVLLKETPEFQQNREEQIRVSAQNALTMENST
jgi:hypothetical protein